MVATSTARGFTTTEREMIFHCREKRFLDHTFEQGETPSQPQKLVYIQLKEDRRIDRELTRRFGKENTKPFMANFFGGVYWPITKQIAK